MVFPVMTDTENNFSKISLMKTNFINHTKQTNKKLPILSEENIIKSLPQND